MIDVKGTSGGHLVHSPCSSRDTYSHLPRIMSSFWIPWRMETPQSLCSTRDSTWSRPQWKSVSWCSGGILRVSLYYLLSPGTTEKSLAPPPIIYLYTLTRSPPKCFLLQAEQSQISQPFFIWEMLQSLYHLCRASLDSLQYVHVSLVLGNPELDTVLQALTVVRVKIT